MIRLSVANKTLATEPTVEWKLFTRETGEAVNIGDIVTCRYGTTGMIIAWNADLA